MTGHPPGWTVASARSPSDRWNYQHGGRARQRRAGYPGKICHSTRWSARMQVIGLIVSSFRRLRYLNTYPCRWGPDYRDGEVAPLHWHVGRRSPRRRG